MKQSLRYISLVAVLVMTTLVAQARTFHIDADAVRGDLTMQLRAMITRATSSDTVLLNFGKGTYTIDGTIQFKCHVVIKGAGRDKSTIILDKGNNRGGQKAFTDDTFFKIYGTLRNPLTFSMSDLTIKLKEHKGIWWTAMEMYAVKVHHANRVEISNVNSYMQDAKITNFDLHVCSNVYVTDCIVSNLNNCDTGGNVWVRGTMDNINIKRNKFYKYGKDEVVAIFDRLVDNTNGYLRGKAVRTNIFIEGNEFYYGGYQGKDKDVSAFNQMLLSLITDHMKSNDKCDTRNFHVNGNKFYINDVCTRCMYISFDPADSHEGIYIENNQIVNSALDTDMRYYRQDIEVNDLSSCDDMIHITGNTVRNKNVVLNNSGSNGYSFLLMQGGNVEMKSNRIVNEATVNPLNGKSTGTQLVWCGASGGAVNMYDNVCKGVKFIATVGAGDGAQTFTLNARNNHFEGDTRIYCNKINQLNLDFTSNTFISEDMNFFLQEFAPRGTLVFNNNDVTVKKGNGQLMTHWDKKFSTSKLRFERLEVSNNVFKGVKNEEELLRNMTNVKKRTVRNNIVKR